MEYMTDLCGIYGTALPHSRFLRRGAWIEIRESPIHLMEKNRGIDPGVQKRRLCLYQFDEDAGASF